VTTPYASEAFIHQVLGKALAAGASDVHLKVGQPPGARVRGDMVFFRVEKIRPEDTDAAARVILGSAGAGRLEGIHELVTAYEADGLGRFRVSIYRQREALALVMRSVPLKIPTFAELGVPTAATALAEKERGLVILAGGSSEGKSSTAAAMIGHLNESYPKHVITLEEPIEHLHEDHRASISQREIGVDTASLSAGLHAAMRQDPDVIFAADLRDERAFAAALEAVELGHLVIAGVAAPDATHAVARLFALGRGVPELAPRLAAALQGVLAHRLLPKRDGSGVVLSCEVLIATAAVRDALRGVIAAEGTAPAAALRELMEHGQSPYGMATFEMADKQLVAQGLVSKSILS
jgi:twitching motility protein PilT